METITVVSHSWPHRRCCYVFSVPSSKPVSLQPPTAMLVFLLLSFCPHPRPRLSSPIDILLLSLVLSFLSFLVSFLPPKGRTILIYCCVLLIMYWVLDACYVCLLSAAPSVESVTRRVRCQFTPLRQPLSFSWLPFPAIMETQTDPRMASLDTNSGKLQLTVTFLT